MALCRITPQCTCVWRRFLLSRGLFGGNKAEKEEKRKQIWAEIDKGYFADLHEFRRNRGKRMEAPDHLCSKGESVFFPSVAGRSLSGDPLSFPPNGHVSMILVSMRGLGMAMCDQYRVPFEREFSAHPDVLVYELSLLDKAIFRLIQGWMERNLRKKLDKQRHSSFMVYSGGGSGGSVGQLRQTLAIGNTIVGHVFLLDREGCIRWRAHASPKERELRALIKCTKQLLDSNSKNRANR